MPSPVIFKPFVSVIVVSRSINNLFIVQDNMREKLNMLDNLKPTDKIVVSATDSEIEKVWKRLADHILDLYKKTVEDSPLYDRLGLEILHLNDHYKVKQNIELINKHGNCLSSDYYLNELKELITYVQNLSRKLEIIVENTLSKIYQEEILNSHIYCKNILYIGPPPKYKPY